MTRFAAFALFGVVAVLVSTMGVRVSAAPVPKHLMKEGETDKAKLQGKWKVESLQMGGKDVLGPLGANFDMVVEFNGDQFAVSANIAGMVQKSTATVKYGAGVKQMSTTNLQTTDANGKPVNAGQQKDDTFGYAFDGEKLLMGSSGNGEKRIVDPLKPGANDIVIVLVRVK